MTDTDHLRGPWQAVITDENRCVSWLTVEDATAKASFADDHFFVSVVQGSALPTGAVPPLEPPAAWLEADMACEVECPLRDSDERLSLRARFAQAQAMAAGLNGEGDRADLEDEIKALREALAEAVGEAA